MQRRWVSRFQCAVILFASVGIAARTGLAREIELDPGRSFEFPVSHPEAILVFSPNTRYLAVPCRDEVVLFDLDEEKRVYSIPLDRAKCGALAWSPDSQLLAVGDSRGRIALYDPGGQRKGEFTIEGQPVTTSAFDPTGKLLAAGTARGHLAVFSSEDSRLIREYNAHKGAVISIHFTRTDSSLVTFGADQFMKRFQIDHPDPVQKVSFEELHGICGVGANEEGDLFALACRRFFYGLGHTLVETRSVRILDGTGRVQKILAENRRDILNLIAMSHDGAMVVTSGAPVGGHETVRVWDVAEGKEAGSIELPERALAAQFGSGRRGRWLAVLTAAHVLGYGVRFRGEQLETTIAVLDFAIVGVEPRQKEQLSAAVSDRARHEIVNSRQFQVLSRDKMKEILGEQRFQMLMVSEDTRFRVQCGKLLGAQHLVAGRITKLGTIYQVHAELLDVESGGLQKSKNEDVTIEDPNRLGELLFAVERVLRALVFTK